MSKNNIPNERDRLSQSERFSFDWEKMQRYGKRTGIYYPKVDPMNNPTGMASYSDYPTEEEADTYIPHDRDSESFIPLPRESSGSGFTHSDQLSEDEEESEVIMIKRMPSIQEQQIDTKSVKGSNRHKNQLKDKKSRKTEQPKVSVNKVPIPNYGSKKFSDTVPFVSVKSSIKKPEPSNRLSTDSAAVSLLQALQQSSHSKKKELEERELELELQQEKKRREREERRSKQTKKKGSKLSNVEEVLQSQQLEHDFELPPPDMGEPPKRSTQRYNLREVNQRTGKLGEGGRKSVTLFVKGKVKNPSDSISADLTDNFQPVLTSSLRKGLDASYHKRYRPAESIEESEQQHEQKQQQRKEEEEEEQEEEKKEEKKERRKSIIKKNQTRYQPSKDNQSDKITVKSKVERKPKISQDIDNRQVKVRAKRSHTTKRTTKVVTNKPKKQPKKKQNRSVSLRVNNQDDSPQETRRIPPIQFEEKSNSRENSREGKRNQRKRKNKQENISEKVEDMEAKRTKKRKLNEGEQFQNTVTRFTPASLTTRSGRCAVRTERFWAPTTKVQNIPNKPKSQRGPTGDEFRQIMGFKPTPGLEFKRVQFNKNEWTYEFSLKRDQQISSSGINIKPLLKKLQKAKEFDSILIFPAKRICKVAVVINEDEYDLTMGDREVTINKGDYYRIVSEESTRSSLLRMKLFKSAYVEH